MTQFYFDLTAHEREEFNQLKQKLFGADKFKIFTKEEEESADFKRYDYILKKKINYLKQIQNQK